MLILCLLFFASPALSSATEDDTQSCDDIHNCRTLFDILWGCLATVFACTWLAVHPNVPSPTWGIARTMWERVKIMLIAIIAPEIIVFWAMKQYFHARRCSKDMCISITHAFFLSMGGFVHEKGHPITLFTYETMISYADVIRQVPIECILDKSKGDMISKTFALCQTSWFIVQCLVRVAQSLPITDLERSTLAFASLNFFIYFLWWNKPLGVEQPIVFACNGHRDSTGPSGTVSHRDSTSSSGTVSHRDSTSSSGTVSHRDSTSSSGTVSHRDSTSSSGTVSHRDSTSSSGTVSHRDSSQHQRPYSLSLNEDGQPYSVSFDPGLHTVPLSPPYLIPTYFMLWRNLSVASNDHMAPHDDTSLTTVTHESISSSRALLPTFPPPAWLKGNDALRLPVSLNCQNLTLPHIPPSFSISWKLPRSISRRMGRCWRALCCAMVDFGNQVSARGVLRALQRATTHIWLLGPIEQSSVSRNPLCVPTMWAGGTDLTIPVRIHFKSSLASLTCEAGAAIVFGSIHITGWSVPYRSNLEVRIWQVCCIALVAIPVNYYIMWSPIFLRPRPYFRILSFLTMPFSIFYILARVALIVVALSTLRSLPYDVFLDVEWPTCIPHI